MFVNCSRHLKQLNRRAWLGGGKRRERNNVKFRVGVLLSNADAI